MPNQDERGLIISVEGLLPTAQRRLRECLPRVVGALDIEYRVRLRTISRTSLWVHSTAPLGSTCGHSSR